MTEFNKVILVGNLTRDPELRFTPQATPTARFGLAVNRPAPKNQRSEVDYFDIVVFGRQAEACKEFLHKGSMALVEGRLQQRRWESPEGQRRSKIEIIAQTVKFLSPRPSPPAAPAAPEAPRSGTGTEMEGEEPEDDIPF